MYPIIPIPNKYLPLSAINQLATAPNKFITPNITPTNTTPTNTLTNNFFIIFFSFPFLFFI